MERQSYFLEQLCTIGIAGAYGGVMAAMYWGNANAPVGENTLLSILVPWIQHVVLAGSVVLLVLVLFRAIGVWRAAGQMHVHDHDHELAAGHPHDHVHEEHGEHNHAHHGAHAHEHLHTHDHGHEHAWSPWRYAVLPFPLMLFFLPFDYNGMIKSFVNERAKIGSGAGIGATLAAGAGDALGAVGVLSAWQSPVERALAPLMSQFGFTETGSLQFAMDRLEETSAGPPDTTPDLAELEKIGVSPEQRDLYRSYKRVETEGMFNPAMRPDGKPDGRFFYIVRLRMACCLNDARPSSIPARSQKKLDLPPGQWVKVQGRVDFVQHQGKWQAVMRAFRVDPSAPPANPYLN